MKSADRKRGDFREESAVSQFSWLTCVCSCADKVCLHHRGSGGTVTVGWRWHNVQTNKFLWLGRIIKKTVDASGCKCSNHTISDAQGRNGRSRMGLFSDALMSWERLICCCEPDIIAKADRLCGARALLHRPWESWQTASSEKREARKPLPRQSANGSSV